MPHRSRQGYDGIPPDVYLKMARDPEAFEKGLAEWDERRTAAVEAEGKLNARLDDLISRETNVVEREKNAAQRIAELDERRRALEADEDTLTACQRNIAEREAAAEALEASLAEREVEIEDKIKNALGAVRELFVASLEPLEAVTKEIVEAGESQ